ncbi:GNAT family N-acetyltransferase [Euzebya sp.]|uniref:GNAT family N-acetyltransferase n=1 Tax=Euzebya sp. TaxID=1971409 RepID=UPI00351129D2
MAAFFAPERLETDAFTLRCYLPGDGAALADATTSSYDHLRPWMGWASADQTVTQSEELVRRFRADYLVNADFVLGIWAPDGSALWGGTGFHRHGGVERGVAEIGMWIRADRAGRGLGTAALRAVLGWGFDAWPWERLAWHCDERNTASRRTAEAAGMRHEGALRGDVPEVGEGRRTTLVYGLTRADV